MDDELESQTLNTSSSSIRNGKGMYMDRKPTGDDPVSDFLLKQYYKLRQPSMRGIQIAIGLTPLVAILFFYLFISSTTSNIITFSALIISLVFIAISMWMLCWILDKDTGSRAMQDISDPIKEGSEGFFIT